MLLFTAALWAGELPVQEPQRIHTVALVIYAHNDVLYRSVMRGKDIGKRINSGHTDLPRIKEGGIDVQVFAVCDFPNLTEGLLQRGYTEAGIRKLLGENVLCVLSAQTN